MNITAYDAMQHDDDDDNDDDGYIEDDRQPVYVAACTMVDPSEPTLILESVRAGVSSVGMSTKASHVPGSVWMLSRSHPHHLQSTVGS